MMMPSLNLFSPPKVTIKRRRYVLDDDDHDDKKTSATATTGTVTCEYHDVHDSDHSLQARPTKRHRRCITPVPSLSNISLFLPILEDPETAIQEGESPPPSFPLAYRQEEGERRDGAGRSVSPSNYHFDETTPFLQPKKKKISLLQDIEQEEEQQPYDIEQEEQQGNRRCCQLNTVVNNNNSNNNSNPSPLPARMMIKSTSSNSSSYSNKYVKSHARGYQEGTVQRQRHTPRRVLPTPPFFSNSSSSVTTHNIDDTISIVEQFQRAIRLSEEQDQHQEQEELPPSTIKTPPSFDMLRY